MWNKRRDEEPQRSFSPPPPPVASSPVEARKEPAPVSNVPVGRFEPESRGGSANIGKAVKIEGKIISQEDLYVDGELSGTVEALQHKLTVGPNGRLEAGVKARELVVLGFIHGDVEAADKIEIRKDARLEGNIKTARIIIEDGAYFKGSIDIVKPEPVKPPARPQPAAPAPAPAPAPPHVAATVPDRR
jgi:cytoskeletal protein CcmA (bactofilin family)